MLCWKHPKGSDAVKLLWLCNMAPGPIREARTGIAGSGLWMDHVLSDLRKIPDLEIRILCRDTEDAAGKIDDAVSYGVFSEPVMHQYRQALEALFREELRSFHPDVIHIWGTEYGHTLAMVNAAAAEGLLERTAVSIQGLCSVYARHYAEGVPDQVQRSSTLRDFLRRDNILRQQEKYRIRGTFEEEALKKVRHIIGRTCWDKACCEKLNPGAQYHFCNETLREPFYEGQWQYASCRKHRIFAPSCVYPVKGFHYLLEAFGQLTQKYPDAVLAVPGESFLVSSGKNRLLQQTYHKYLARLVRKYGLENKIEFLGSLPPEGMKREYLRCQVFALPSTIENSPNSLGEAMLLGVPCVAADVGGVSTMLCHEKEGYLYQSTAPYMLSHYISRIFDMEEKAEALGASARAHALVTHDPKINAKTLLSIYAQLSGPC